jgi:hypothetical protein
MICHQATIMDADVRLCRHTSARRTRVCAYGCMSARAARTRSSAWCRIGIVPAGAAVDRGDRHRVAGGDLRSVLAVAASDQARPDAAARYLSDLDPCAGSDLYRPLPPPDAAHDGAGEDRRDGHRPGDREAIGRGERARALEPQDQGEDSNQQQPIDLWDMGHYLTGGIEGPRAGVRS